MGGDAGPHRAAVTRAVGHLRDRLADAGLTTQADLLSSAPGVAPRPAAPDRPVLPVTEHLDAALATVSRHAVYRGPGAVAAVLK